MLKPAFFGSSYADYFSKASNFMSVFILDPLDLNYNTIELLFDRLHN